MIGKFTAFLIFVFTIFCLEGFAQNDTSKDFTSYTQNIPGTDVSFKMIAIPAGTFRMGSPENEKGHRADEGSATEVKLNAFWMEEHEVTYDEFVLFLDEGRDTGPLPDGVTPPIPPNFYLKLCMGKNGGFTANSMSQ
jgi:formylglycine-generating enzyme required for sulfatase activity